MAATSLRCLRPSENVLFWYIVRMKRQKAVSVNLIYGRSNSHQHLMSLRRRRRELLQIILTCVNPPRARGMWTKLRSFAWFEMVETSFTDKQWYDNFRVRKDTLAWLLGEIKEDIFHEDTIMRKAIPARHRLALTLYYLASTAEYRTIGNLFGVSASFVCLCIRQVCRAIRRRLVKVINFPQGENLKKVMQDYEDKWGFPMCAGAIDGTHIRIIAPKEGQLDYVNRKDYHSVIMQAIVDSNYLFRDIVVGWPGSVHDARVLSNSSIYKNASKIFENATDRQISGVHIPPVIIGDPAYPLLSWLMKPYSRSQGNSRCEHIFNHRLSQARMTVENTFARWKGRFIRFMKRVDMEVSNVIDITVASCILHNICEAQKNEFLPNWKENYNSEETSAPPQQWSSTTVLVNRDSVDIRDTLAHYFVTER